MGLFDEVNKKFGSWIEIIDAKNENITIEDFDYEHGVHGMITKKHCVKCVSANRCWFKNEKIKNQNRIL